ncbi:MAG: cation:proton antiporter [gamma proteobacterium symbiont of Bathyaustriella thionipta]|nr:cation:proton antiporter [gamma proteobacterium symbiont of Bathyaustriella thionipta]MCU7949803.1 cation:proton antiporter [gamma proteobacterium symbiont of Bathyaustriella thionipta]MCU7951832.1 cation:proton antiporter [gamma proteobacterium symbiont of Bathyaustriella thionipta]MCU7956398.1 cation:proton antiporter [gamma proteobacterium symbiont of Bathyaustriella thionipta]MCU7968904.1 cation:proton antiporter [gamma proteobacterium symbiont of Bathyaustriella thionipta]
MEAHVFFLHLLTILLLARVFAEIAVYLGAPSVIGELLAGVVIGPSLLGWVEPDKILELLAEIGIILLLFEVGLKTDGKRLLHSGFKSVVVASSGFIFPMLFGFAISYWYFELSLLVSLFVGGTITATSIGITVRVLKELNCQHAHEGHVVLGAAVLDDIFGVVLLVVLYEFSISGGVSFFNIGKVLLFIGTFFAVAPIAAKLMSVYIKRLDQVSEIPGLIPTTIVSLVLFFSWVSHSLGAPELIGGFAAGLALSRRFFMPFGLTISTDKEFASSIESQMKPIIQLFTPIFFVYIGLSLNLREIDWSSPFIWGFSMTVFVLSVIGKMIGPFFIKETIYSKWAIGMAMVPRGEIGLIFAELGKLSGILNNEIHAGMVIVIVLTTLLSPFVMKWYHDNYASHLCQQ